ncbi:MAG: peptide-methionine (S)-S-oxide reductase MsrA [Acidobacteria bacterium]|nr:peptide-methionine (S)-S-oxide reductase MsrA [Acidobacteriota bacterium]
MKRFLGLVSRIALTVLVAATSFRSMAEPPKPKPAARLASFAGGCFWCMEGPFDKLDGVLSTTSGYTGGKTKDPTYEEVSSGTTGHAEAVQIAYDPTKIAYEKLLEVFWHNIDPVSPNGQFCDRGNQYRPGVFVHDAEQRKAAEASRAALEKSGRFGAKIPVEITDATTFYAAEEYHQNYYEKNPIRYKFYRSRCGRDDRLKELWGDPAKH